MDFTDDARAALAQADALQARGRRASRWLATFEALFGAASFAMALGFGLLQGRTGATIVLMVLWLAAITGLCVYAVRQKAWWRHGGRVHGFVMVLWTVAWAGTVALGSGPLAGQLWPWVVGGLVMLGSCLGGAWWILRKPTP